MNLTYQQRRNIRSIVTFTALTSIGGAINALVEHGFNWYPVINELILGFLFGLIISVSEIFYLEKKLRRVRFSTAVVQGQYSMC